MINLRFSINVRNRIKLDMGNVMCGCTPLTIRETETLTSNGFLHINTIYTFNNHLPILLIIYFNHKSHAIGSQ